MFDFISVVVTQSLTFLPLALGISVSYHLLRATDMTIDGSFVLGAGIFAHLITLGYSPYLAALIAIAAGMLAGVMVACIQRGGRVDPLLAGVLATFILSSLNLCLMGRPNLSLLQKETLLSNAFTTNVWLGWLVTACYCFAVCGVALIVLQRTRLGLDLRALGDNPQLLQRLGHSIEKTRMAGFALTNALAAASGCLTAQTIGYADIGMGLGMTLTGVGAIILGQQILKRFYHRDLLRLGSEWAAAFLGVIVYFGSLNLLLKLDIDPLYLKLILGVLLIFFLRTAVQTRFIRP